ncbi:MAG: TonB family protein [Gammaproteobacteria bacterium]|nr:TonB family protein [Gammaproteobacteria bacterium]MYK83793.1 TonB family protein [Gammaproteobacteria bacterium]
MPSLTWTSPKACSMPSLAISPEAPLAAPVAPPARERFGFALFLALCLHAILILGVTFTPPERTVPSRPLEVVLVGPAGTAESERAAPGAPASDPGETAPVELADVQPPVAQAPRPVAQAPRPAAQTPLQAEPYDPPSPIADAAPPAQPQRRNFAALSGEIAALGLAMANEDAAGAGAPRIRQLSSLADKSAVEAAYLEMWRARVERIGTANYPGNGVAGELRMQVVIRDDGALLDARIIEPSGVAPVDAAALRIVRLAAPFAQFPVEMRKSYDQLQITRTWRFSRTGARLGD